MKILKSPVRITLFILGLVVLALFMYKNDIGPFAHDWLHIVDYPGAQNVQLVVADKVKDSGYDPRYPYKAVTFVTADTSDRVFTFYNNDLAGRGAEDWRTSQPEQTGPNNLLILGFGHRDVSATMYRFTIKTE